MTKVFVGGSRQVSRLNAEVRRRLDRIIEKELPVVVGDANGADKAVQRYFDESGYRRVEVFCSGPECRNNLGRWPERHVPVAAGDRGFAFYATKDAAMAREASVGLMIWDRKSVGTLLNVSRLVEQQKTAVVYIVPERRFLDIKTELDWEALLACGGPVLRREFERRAGTPAGIRSGSRQAGLA
jgi:hypothetical protein